MKFKIGDRVIVTGGKDKGIKSVIVALLPRLNRVIVKDANLYVKHIKPLMDRPGEKVRRERALPVAKIAVLNDKDQADRLAYRLTADGKKERYFKKSGAAAIIEKAEKAMKADIKAKKKEARKAKKTRTSDAELMAKEAIKADQKAAKKASTKTGKVTRVRKTQDKG